MLLTRTTILCMLIGATLLQSCNNTKPNEKDQPEEISNTVVNENPPAEGFDLVNSDPKAIAIADSVMKAMGGRKSWDDTRYIAWNFFGARDLLWDKHTGDVRIEWPQKNAVFLINVHDKTGKIMQEGQELTEPDSLATMIKRATGIWINDAYWLVMPFKLKDSGVTLKYARQDTTEMGEIQDVLQLTFTDVGDTPQNKYEIYVDLDYYLVSKWAFYAEAGQEKPSYVWPFDNYQQFGDILLSSDRSDEKGPRNTKVLEKVPEGIFEHFDHTPGHFSHI